MSLLEANTELCLIIQMSHFKKAVLVALGLHFVTAIFSVGYHHFDEHFQILEFMNFLNGKTLASELAWEHGEQLRPWLMPWFFKGLSGFFGIENPFNLALVFRFISLIIGFSASLVLCKLAVREYKANWVPWVVLLTWFIPYMNVRTSSESYSTSLFVIAVAGLFLLYPKLKMDRGEKVEVKPWHLSIIGALLGLSFHCRYQMGVSVFAFFVWMVYSKQFSIKACTSFLMGMFVTLSFGVWLDQLAYGGNVFAPWNYFRTNLIEGKAAEFSRDPFWFFITKPLARGVPPVSLVLFFGTLFFWLKKRGNVWTWVTFSFFLIHTIVSHKEVRFLNFVYFLAPFMCCYAITEYKHLLEKKWLVRTVAGVNILLLVVAAFRSPRKAVNFYEATYNKNIERIYLYEANTPFLQTGLIPRFYLPKIPEVQAVESGVQVPGYYFVEKLERLRELNKIQSCELKYSSLPKWIVDLMSEKMSKRTRTWGLFYCKSEFNL